LRARVWTPRAGSTTIAAGAACAARVVVRTAPEISDPKTRSSFFVGAFS
jgi:S-adenosylmethionine:diacylglycerol 3-amino-3-carboxypropyl transferase